MAKTSVVIPNWNGAAGLPSCLDALLDQTEPENIILVDNASTDGSVELLEEKYPKIVLLKNKKNLGFAGGVNTGIRHAMDGDSDYVALINNDAVPAKDWLKKLVACMDKDKRLGMTTSKMVDGKNNLLDSTGEQYTLWGLPFPRGRGEADKKQYDNSTVIFGVSGGASIYRVEMLEEIGLFDEDFFAYYEDVDLSFRAQLAGWKAAYVPEAIVHHQIGATSGKIKGFTTYHALKNLPQILLKDVPGRLFWTIGPRLGFAYWTFFFSALARGQGWQALKGFGAALALTPKKIYQRRKIQSRRKVSLQYIESLIIRDLPPSAVRLRKLVDKLTLRRS